MVLQVHRNVTLVSKRGFWHVGFHGWNIFSMISKQNELHGDEVMPRVRCLVADDDTATCRADQPDWN